MISGDTDLGRVQHIAPKAIFLSGGPDSVHEGGSPTVPEGFFDYATENGIPVMGICYGMQLLVHRLGGKVGKSVVGGEFGSMAMAVERDSVLFANESSSQQTVWMSHGDDATQLPEGFRCVATSKQGCRVAIEDPKRKFFGLQYHPEVVHSKRGLETIRHFLTGIAGADVPPCATLPPARTEPGHSAAVLLVRRSSVLTRDSASCSPGRKQRTAPESMQRELCAGRHSYLRVRGAGLDGDWSMHSAIDAEKEVIRSKVGPDEHVICALSGGVDSTVAATLVHQVRGACAEPLSQVLLGRNPCAWRPVRRDVNSKVAAALAHQASRGDLARKGRFSGGSGFLRSGAMWRSACSVMCLLKQVHEAAVHVVMRLNMPHSCNSPAFAFTTSSVNEAAVPPARTCLARLRNSLTPLVSCAGDWRPPALHLLSTMACCPTARTRAIFVCAYPTYTPSHLRR
jgi:GMP synthase (glutamine-hydrolysing) A subunit